MSQAWRKRTHSAEFQAVYENEKRKKAIDELKQQNEEMAAAIKGLNATYNACQRVMYLMLYELGGEFKISNEEFNGVEGKIIAMEDPEKKFTTFILQGPEQKEKDMEHYELPKTTKEIPMPKVKRPKERRDNAL